MYLYFICVLSLCIMPYFFFTRQFLNVPERLYLLDHKNSGIGFTTYR